MTRPRLRLEGLRKDFGRVAAVDGIDLALAEGELVALLGPSGCGKTTTLRMVGGLEQPTAGRILLDEEVVAGPGVTLPPERRRMGMVFQSYALWPHMTVAENIGYGLKLRGRPGSAIREKVDGLLKFVEMSGYGARYPSELSGGQQQRVSVARALATDPEVVLFDEPLSNLDATLREAMRFELRRIHAEVGLTGLYVTHSQEEAFALGDRVAVMNRGRIEQIAPPDELYERPATEFVARFVGLANIWAGRLLGREGGIARIALEDGTEIRSARPGTDAAGAVQVLVRPENIRLLPAGEPAPAGLFNLFEGIIRDVVFSGALADVFLDCGERRVRLQQLGGMRPRVGEIVRIAFAGEHAALLPSSVAP